MSSTNNISFEDDETNLSKNISQKEIKVKNQLLIYKIKWTPLHRAIINGDLESARKLLENGEDPNITNKVLF